MNQYFKPDFWRYALRDPLTWMALAVDAVPVIMVIFFGWGAEALVLLYWAENIVIGVATIGRLAFSSARSGLAGAFMAAFLIPFFAVHYGMFCFGHGVFVFGFAESVDLNPARFAPSPGSLLVMFETIRTGVPWMTLVLALIGLYQLIAVIRDYWPVPGKSYPEPMEEMFSPYGRIVTLHVAIILGAFVLLALDNPMAGVLLLILLRMAVSIIGRAWRDQQSRGKKRFDPFAPIESKDNDRI